MAFFLSFHWETLTWDHSAAERIPVGKRASASACGRSLRFCVPWMRLSSLTQLYHERTAVAIQKDRPWHIFNRSHILLICIFSCFVWLFIWTRWPRCFCYIKGFSIGKIKRCNSNLHHCYCTIVAERVGFEPTEPCGSTDFESVPLWPLRYRSIFILRDLTHTVVLYPKQWKSQAKSEGLPARFSAAYPIPFSKEKENLDSEESRFFFGARGGTWTPTSEMNTRTWI